LDWVFVGIGENLFNFCLVLTVYQHDSYQPTGLSRLIVDGLPQSHRGRYLGGMAREMIAVPK
jgi:hypothetical protein